MVEDKIVVFDIETAMWLPEDKEYKKAFTNNVKQVVVMCTVELQDASTKKVWHDSLDYARDGTVEEGIEYLLQEGHIACGHNIKGFDIPALKLMYPEYKDRLEAIRRFDTLLASRQMYPAQSLMKYDRDKGIANHDTTKAPHGLEAWGNRMKNVQEKDMEFSNNVCWGSLKVSDKLIHYCMGDVIINAKVAGILIEKNKQNKEKENGQS